MNTKRVNYHFFHHPMIKSINYPLHRFPFHTGFSGPSGPTAESFSHAEVHSGPPYLPIPYDTHYHIAPTAHEQSHAYHSSYGTGPEGRNLQPRVSENKKKARNASPRPARNIRPGSGRVLLVH